MKLQKINYQQGAQTILNMVATYFIFVAFSADITPHVALIYMLVLQWVFHIIQWFKKIQITLVFVLIVAWTISLIVNWPGTAAIIPLTWKDYATGLGSLLFALSGWLMHNYNNKRW